MNLTEKANEVRQVGQVKWFNNKAGYGFITVSDGDNKGKDIFAHYSTISVGDTQYKYLVQGEYVEFDLIASTNESHEFQSVNITGIKGGQLMCETRQTNRPRTFERPRPYRSEDTEFRREPRRDDVRYSEGKYDDSRREVRNDRERRERQDDGFERVQKKKPVRLVKSS